MVTNMQSVVQVRPRKNVQQASNQQPGVALVAFLVQSAEMNGVTGLSMTTYISLLEKPAPQVQTLLEAMAVFIWRASRDKQAKKKLCELIKVMPYLVITLLIGDKTSWDEYMLSACYVSAW